MMSGDSITYLRDFLGFSFLLPDEHSGFFWATSHVLEEAWPNVLLRVGLCALGALLWIAGLSRAEQVEERLFEWRMGSLRWVWICAGIAGTCAIAGFVYMVERFLGAAANPTLPLTRALIPLPLGLVAASLGFERLWSALPSPRSQLVAGVPGLIVLLATVPIVTLAVASLKTPLLIQRSMVVLGPYLLLCIAYGIARLAANRILSSMLVLLLALAHVFSMESYWSVRTDPIDYGSFATLLRSNLRDRDLIFLRRSWAVTPILFYLPADRFRFAAENFDGLSKRHPESDVWVLLLHEAEPSAAMQVALGGYELVRSVEAAPWRALRYRRKSSSPAGWTLPSEPAR